MYHLHTKLRKTDERSRDCRRFRLEGKKEPGGVEDQRLVLQLRVFDVTFFAVEDEKCILASFGAVLISFFTFSMSYGKNLTSKMGFGNLLFLHQHRRPRQTASKEAVEKNVGDLNETVKLLPRIVCLCGFFSRFFSSCWCGVGVWKFSGCFVFMIALGRQLDCESVSLHSFYIDPHVSCRLKEIQYTVYYSGKSHIPI